MSEIFTGIMCFLIIVLFLGLRSKGNNLNGDHNFITFEMLDEKDLEDKKSYIVFEKMLYNDEYYFHSAIWDKHLNAFHSMRYYFKYEDVIAVVSEIKKPLITSYNPAEINALDIEELSKICFQVSDENTQSDEIWEKLIEYFDKRNLSK